MARLLSSWFLSLAAQGALLSITDIWDEEYYGEADVAAPRSKPPKPGDDRCRSRVSSLADADCLFHAVQQGHIEAAGLPDLKTSTGRQLDLDMREVALATTVDFDNDGTNDQWELQYTLAFLTITK